jgi:HEAT repeat protein
MWLIDRCDMKNGMSIRQLHLRGVVSEVLHVAVWFALLVGVAYGQGSQDQVDEVLSLKVRSAIDDLKRGSYGPTTQEQIAEAQAGQLVPILEARFVRSQDAEVKAKLARALVNLGDKGDAYWDFLVQQATTAIESDAPSPRCLGSPANCPQGHPPEYVAWAKAHNIASPSPAEAALYGLWGKVYLIFDDPRGIPLLRRALESPNYEIVSAGAQGLAVIHDKDSIPLIIEACKRVPVEVARSLASSLKYFDDDPRALAAADMYLPKPPDPVEALKKDDGESISYFVEQIVQTHAVQAIPILKDKFVSTQDVNDKVQIASALVRLGDKDDTYWDFLVRQAAPAIESDAPPIASYDSQGKFVRGPSPEFVAWAKAHNVSLDSAAEDSMYRSPGKVMMLAVTGDPRGIPLLRRALSSSNFMIQTFAAEGLAGMKDKDSIPLIIAACQRAPTEVAAMIAESLMYFDDPQAQSAADRYLPKESAKALREAKAKGRNSFGVYPQRK